MELKPIEFHLTNQSVAHLKWTNHSSTRVSTPAEEKSSKKSELSPLIGRERGAQFFYPIIDPKENEFSLVDRYVTKAPHYRQIDAEFLSLKVFFTVEFEQLHWVRLKYNLCCLL